MSAARNYRKAIKRRAKRFTVETSYNRKEKHDKHTRMAQQSPVRRASR